MIKRLLCLMLCIIMLISTFVLSGCSSAEDDNDGEVQKEASRGTKTLNMYVMTENETDPEAAKAVEEAFNKITKSKFKTKVNLFFYTEAEYYTALENTFTQREAAIAAKKQASDALKQYIKDNNKEMSRAEAMVQFYIDHPEYKQYEETTVDPEAETTVEETIFNEETGLLELKYPEADPNVADIFFISGYDKYTEYIEKGWLSKLDDELSGNSKEIKTLVSDIFIDNVKYNSATYAIPNNRTIGEYTYMLVNKELLAKYYYNISSITTLADCKDFLADVAEFEKDVVPIDGAPDMYNVFYWNIDPDTLEIKNDEFSICGTTNSIKDSLGIPMLMSSMFVSKKQFKDQLLYNKLYEELGYFRSNVAEDAKCAVKIVKGGADLEKVYADEYEMVVLENPMAQSADIYEYMFAVGGYTSDVARSMEIITELNTKVELRNLLQYGIEDVNYTLDANGQVVYTENNKYFMDVNKTGNVFIAYTEAGTDADAWEYGKKQNGDVNVYQLHGFTMAPEKVDVDAIKKMQQLSDSVKARIDACKTYDELSALIDILARELRTQNNTDIKDYLSIETPAKNGRSTPYILLNDWMIKKGIIEQE